MKQSLVSSYNRVLAPKVKASVTAAVDAAAATENVITIGQPSARFPWYIHNKSLKCKFC